MNINKGLMASLLAISLLPIECTNVSAVESYSSPTELVTAMVEKSLSGITSDTMSDAISTMQSKITTNGDEVFYDGHSIGYWYSDDPTYLYADASKTSKNIGLNWEVNPKTLSIILTDVNEELVDTIVPTTSDWSKIIGKYDVTLGDVTIPANQWVPATVGSDPIGNNTALDIFKLTGIKGTDLKNYASDKAVFASAYLIDTDGTLYLGDYLQGTGRNSSSYYSIADSITYGVRILGTFPYAGGYSTFSTIAEQPLLKLALVPTSNPNEVRLTYYSSDTTGNTKYSLSYSNTDDKCYNLFKVDDTLVKFTGDYKTAKQVGIVYMTGEQLHTTIKFDNSGYSQLTSIHTKFFEKQSSSRKTIGNQIIRRRISALNSLLPTDTVTLNADGWTVNGLTSIDTYISNQELNAAGDTADIPAVADIDALTFNVVLPTALPIFVDSSNVTYVADNANIINKSGAAVELTGVEITPEANSGWTMVNGSPSKDIGGNEFNFSTTIEKNKVLDVNETYPFTYMANLSPTTESSTSLELATVMVTVDWATTSGG